MFFVIQQSGWYAEGPGPVGPGMKRPMGDGPMVGGPDMKRRGAATGFGWQPRNGPQGGNLQWTPAGKDLTIAS